jgi:hypothetical protein
MPRRKKPIAWDTLELPPDFPLGVPPGPPPRAPEKKILEKDVERPVKAYAREHGGEPRKFTSPQHRSVPDDIFFFPTTGRTFYVEFKRPGERPSDDQVRELHKIKRAGNLCFVIDNEEDGKRLVDWGLSEKLPADLRKLPGWFDAVDYPKVVLT